MSKINAILNKFNDTGSKISITGEGNVLGSFTVEPEQTYYLLFAGIPDVYGIYKIKSNKLDDRIGCGIICYTDLLENQKTLSLNGKPAGTDFSASYQISFEFAEKKEYLFFIPPNSYMLAFIKSPTITRSQYTFSITYGND